MLSHWKNKSFEPIIEVIDGISYTERWKDIPGYEGLYKASTMGRIMMFDRRYSHPQGDRIFKKRVVTQTMNKWGYVYVELADKDNARRKIFVHVLVAKTFIKNPKNKPEVNHIKGIKHDCRVHQLEWNTKSENHLHAHKIGLKTANKTMLGKKGDLSPNAVPVNQYAKDGTFIKKWPSQTEAAEKLKLSKGNISSCCIGTYKSTGGFKFQYA